MSAMALAIAIAAIQQGCSAFGSHRLLSGTRFVQHNRIGYTRLNVSSTLYQAGVSSAQGIESEMNKAMEAARDIDKKYGICTEPSNAAWAAVDEIFAKMQAIQNIGDRVSRNNPVQNDNEPPNGRRRTLPTGRTTPADRESKEKVMYFF